MWYTYDLAKYLAENKKYPENCELEHAGEYLKVKNGQYAMLLETCQVETVNEALEYLNNKMEELFQMKPLADEVDTEFRGQFTKTFTKAFMNEVRLIEV